MQLFLEGVPQREICLHTASSRTSVSRIVQAYSYEGGRITDAERSGYPKGTTEEEDRLILLPRLWQIRSNSERNEGGARS